MALSDEQRRNAALIVGVGQQMGLSQRDILIGLMTAMQESSLINNKGGDRDSAGLFQQRPSMGWGSYSQVTDPQYAARKFFSTLQGVGNRDSLSLAGAAQKVQRSAYPDAYAKHESSMRELLGSLGAGGGPSYGSVGVPQGESYEAGSAALNALALGSEGQAAAAPKMDLDLVQSNEVDNSNAVPVSDMKPDELDPNSMDEGDLGSDSVESLKIVAAGEGAAEVKNPVTSQGPAPSVGSEGPGGLSTGKPGVTTDSKKGFVPLGGDYTSMAAPGTAGKIIEKALSFQGTPYKWGGTSPLGFDCSGFTQYVFKQFGVNLPRISYQQSNAGQAVSRDQMRPGDLVFFDYSSRNPGADHVGIFIGNGKVVEAPAPGMKVRVADLSSSHWAKNNWWARRVL